MASIELKSQDNSTKPPDFDDEEADAVKNKKEPTNADQVAEAEKGDDKKGGDDKKKKDEPQKTVTMKELFRYATRFDIILMIIGSIASVGVGISKPLMIIVFGQVIDSFADPNQYCKINQLLKTNETMQQVYSNFTQLANFTCEDIVDKNETQMQELYDRIVARLPEDQLDFYQRLYETAYNTGMINQTMQICHDIIYSQASFLDSTWIQIRFFLIIASVSLVTGYLQTATWNKAAENQVKKIREAFFRNLLRQDVGWYDQQESGAVTSKFAEEILQIHKGINEKVGMVFMSLASFFAGIIIAFIKGWELSLVVLSLAPLLAIVAVIMVKFAFKQSQDENSAYAKAGVIAQEVLASIRTVTSFGGQLREVERYAANLDEARKIGAKKGFTIGLTMGVTFLIIFGSYALGFSYGIFLVNEERPGYTIGVVTMTFYSVIMGTFSLGLSATSLQSFASAKAAAYNVFQIIDRKPKIDAFSKEGKKRDLDEKFDCRIEFKNISFHYPTRPDVEILHDISLEIEPGTTVALVGASGCGKSTIVQLLQRFYDPDVGSVLVDGVDLRDYNVFWFRTLIGSVSQEPILFGATVYENIRYGYPKATKEEIEQAAKQANAHDFIAKLPQGYQTLVGEQGAQLSGGQKQRIAIARALVRNPRILILDEATSALDTESEAIVQDALDRARAGRTTIAIAHRLSTVMGADKIVVIEAGQIHEVGTHAELLAKQGIYAKLVEAQQGRDVEEIDMEFATARERRAALVKRQRRSTITSERDLKLSGIDGEPKKDAVPESKSFALLTPAEKKKLQAGTVKKYYSAKRLWSYAVPDAVYIAAGSVGAIACGAIWPAFAIIFSQMMSAFTECDKDTRYQKGIMNSLIFLAIGVGCFIGFTVMMSAFAYAGENLCARIRKLAFNAMLRQDIAWFDDDDNATGALTSRLSTQCGQVRDATGAQLAQLVQTAASLLIAIIIAFIYDWRVTFVMLAFAPLLVLAGLVRGKAVSDNVSQDKYVEQSTKYLVQSTTNIRTVTSLGVYRIFVDLFNAPLNSRHSKESVKIQIGAFAYGLSEGGVLFAYAATFWAGAQFVSWGWTDFGNMTTALGAIMFSAVAVGQANSMAPDQQKARLAVAEIFKLFDRNPAIQWENAEEKGVKLAKFDGDVVVEDVRFSYPTRPTATVLRNLNIQIQPGQTFALVGASGCGKSTVIQLFERFYDPARGEIRLDGSQLASLNLPWLRGTMSLVSQEPILFDRTIAENISYGVDGIRGKKEGNSASQEEIEEAARLANIHDFIMTLPDGYKTRVGERGTQLSGGQKQRIAIARALVRQPQLLLLDEATSALDSESEKVVQEALERARAGRTVLVIAHRLSTIESADVIAVIQGGEVREIGTHTSLLEKKGLYYGLWSAQQLTR